ncbi:MAG: CSLREA domain-containing protein, partial [Anaerolineae bacterium]|nr:CSLREA domain-containing protein [Anaerolineae bacterium]
MTKIRLLVTIIFCLVLMAPVIQAQEDSSPPAETTEEAPIGVIIIDDPLGEETEIPTPVPTEEPTTPPTPEVTVEPTAEVTIEPTAEITAEPTEPTAEPPAPTETPVATPIVDIFSDNFESGISTHWVLSPGWILTQDNGSFLAAAAAGETALINGIDWPHFLLALRVRGPISIQFRSGTEAYRLAIAETGKASLYRGETLLVEGADAGAADAWHPVNVQALGGVITVAVDRVAQFTYTDPSTLDAGAIRFVSDGAAAFDDVVLNKLDAPLPTPEPTEESTPEVQANFLLPADEPTEPAIFVVNSPRDNSTADDGLCTLREAIESANSSTGLVLYPECGSSAGTSIADNPDIIEFEMNDPLFVSPPYEILPFGCPLPDIIDQVIIDGYSQTGAEPATDSTFAVIRIELNGSNAFSSGSCAANKSNGLHILEGGNGSTIKGLAITRFKANGIYIENASNVTVSGNYIGLENGGSVPQPNLADGIFIDEGTFNTIGGLTAADRNLISSNTANGIHIKGVSTVTETTANNNIIQGNYIGLDRTGLLDRGNDKDGVFIDESEDNLVGGSVAGARNIISGNGDNGVQIKNLNEASGLSLANLVRGNYIGLNYNANGMVPNDDDGVRLSGTRGNTIGGTTAADRNIITGNAGYGVHITKATYQADYNVISGNFIGTNLNGTGLFTSATYNRTGNGLGGVFIEFGTNNYIGDAVSGAGNVIAGNRGNGSGTFYGIYITNNSAANRIYGNLIGVDVTGTVALGNTVGIRISGPSQNFVGSTDPLTRNVISGNLMNGIELAGTGTTDTRVLGNYVGVNVTGNVALPNGGQGILISGAVNSVIGSTDAGATNVISGNTGDGIRLSGSNGVVSETNRIQNNYIGLGADGTTALGNGGNGINVMSFTQRNQIGTDPASPDPQDDIGGNIIAYNTLAGVAIPTDGGVGNSVMKNVIHTNGGLGIDLGNMGVTPNDGGDTDEGANHLQNFPIVTGVSRDSGNITITGSLNTTANSGFSPPLAYRIDFFGNATCDPSNYGEGRTYLDTLTWGDGRITQVGGSTSGNYTFEITIPEQPGVNRITLTATERRPTGTDFDYSTSEFSQCLDPDNNPPAITPIPMSSITTAHNTLSGPVNFNISDVETPVANLTLSATSSDPTIVSNTPSNFQFSCTTGSCTVRVRPNSGADAYGDVNITVIVTDADG